jgi:hypothetical protein
MKIDIDKDNYIAIKKNSDGVVNMSVKAQKDDNSYILISLSLEDDDMDLLISELVSLRAKGS